MNQEAKDSSGYHLEDGIPVLDTKLDEIQREQVEAKKRDKQYSDEQLRLNRKMAWFTAALVFTSAVAGAIGVWQARIANKSANAAESAAQTAKDTLGEMKQGGTDTHELAVQAGIQAYASRRQSVNTELIARAAQRQAATSTVASDAAKASADTAIKELELSERPWVDAQIVIDGPVEFNVNGVNVHLKFQLVNTGRSPALATHISPRMISMFSEGPAAADVLQETCRDQTRVVTQMPHFGVTLFPNHPLEESISFGMGNEELQKATKRVPGQITWPNLIVCIGYRSTFGDRVYHTGYVLDLLRLDTINQQPRVDFKIGESIDKDHLLLRCDAVDCVVAD